MVEIIETRPALGFLEIHAENFLGGGPALRQIAAVRRDYPLSVHGVGLSLGSAEGVDRDHVRRFASLVAQIEPCLVSDHLAWSVASGTYLNDLLPLPYTEEALALVSANIAAVQDALQRPILVENPSRYLRFRHSPIPEPEFLAELVQRTGCRLLCDVNNVFVSAHNLGFDAAAYLDALPAESIGQIHLAGHARLKRAGAVLLVDDHGSRVSPAVWALFRRALARFGARPTLVEWDKQLPPLTTLIEEADIAAREIALSEAGRDDAA